VPLTI